MKLVKELINRFRFHIIRCLSLIEIRRGENYCKSAVYITFDDGPDVGITESVLDLLRNKNIRATFFCCGVNCEKNPKLVDEIYKAGHKLANHTYSHINGFRYSTDFYRSDVERCEQYLDTYIFRPPWGALSFRQYLLLRKKWRVVYWDVSSGDTSLDFDLTKQLEILKRKTKPGSIVLFHFSNEHAANTLKILPLYLDYIISKRFLTRTL